MVARGDLGRGDGLCRAHRSAEDHHSPVARLQPRGDHGDADDGVDDPEPGADARRGQRCRQRRDGRHRCRDALGRDGRRPLSGEGGRGHGGGDPRRREVSARHPRPRAARAEGEFQGTEEAIAMAVMYTANHMQVRAIVALTETGATTAVDVAYPLGHPDLCVHAARGHRGGASRCTAASIR